MELDDFDIDDFLAGKYSKEKVSMVRAKMKEDPSFALFVRSKKLESLVVEEMAQQEWRPDFGAFERKYQQKNNRRQLFTYLSAAVMTGIVLLTIYFLYPPTPPVSGLALNLTKDFNTKSVSKENFNLAVPQLYGNWTTSITEREGVVINLSLTINRDSSFDIQCDLFLNNNNKTGDKLFAGGTWYLDNDQIIFSLNENSIRNAETANPFQMGVVELWLKNIRLFKKPIEIILLNQENLILKLDKSQGLEWTRN